MPSIDGYWACSVTLMSSGRERDHAKIVGSIWSSCRLFQIDSSLDSYHSSPMSVISTTSSLDRQPSLTVTHSAPTNLLSATVNTATTTTSCVATSDNYNDCFFLARSCFDLAPEVSCLQRMLCVVRETWKLPMEMHLCRWVSPWSRWGPQGWMFTSSSLRISLHLRARS